MSLAVLRRRLAVADQLADPPRPVNDRRPRRTDRLYQRAYRLAYAVLRAWWFVRRPHHRGALLALWQDGRLLVLRCSYRRELNLPGGSIHPGEDALAAVLRETHEEIGLVLAPAALRQVAVTQFLYENRHDEVTLFEAELPPGRRIAIDRREIVGFAFRLPGRIRPDEVSPHVASYLGRRS